MWGRRHLQFDSITTLQWRLSQFIATMHFVYERQPHNLSVYFRNTDYVQLERRGEVVPGYDDKLPT